MPARKVEWHRVAPTGRLRAAVLGANDGIVSPASLVVGAAGAHGSHSIVLLVGAMSMAMELALLAEQESYHRIERALNVAHTTTRDLQTKLGHSILERDEAREAGRCSETGRLALTAALGAERTAQQSKQDGYQPAPGSHGSAFGHRPTKPMPATAPEPGEAPVKRRGRPPGSTNSMLPVRLKGAKASPVVVGLTE